MSIESSNIPLEDENKEKSWDFLKSFKNGMTIFYLVDLLLLIWS